MGGMIGKNSGDWRRENANVCLRHLFGAMTLCNIVTPVCG
jgi:hypothetical protein